MLCALAAAAVISAGDPGDLGANFGGNPIDDAKNYGWRCGQPAVLKDGSHDVDGTQWQNLNAGIVFLKEGSLDHERIGSASAVTFDDLFCSKYLSGYKNPNDPANAGVCIRDMSDKWGGILDADREAKETWELFKTKYGYQRTAAKYKDMPAGGFQTLWGSGAEGSNPSNWCDAYMHQMLCHVAFPQFAGDAKSNVTDLPVPAGSFPGFGAWVRPVSRDACESMMDNCNRHEPKPYEGIVPWLEGVPDIDADQSLDNTLYCDAWNRGMHIAKAGTGVGAGDNEDEEMYTASWDSSSALTPIGFLAVAATVMVMLQ